MSIRNSRAMRRRWKDHEYRTRVSQHIGAGVRRTLRPKVVVGVTPNPRRDLPPEITDLLDTLDREALEIVECGPLRIEHHTVWRIALLDGSDEALNERYHLFTHANGLDLYQLHSRPLPDLGGVSVVLVVGVSKEEEGA